MSSKIQEKLATATEVEVSKRRNETISDQSYLKRLCLATEALSDADWKALSRPAQDWYNLAADQAKIKKDLPAFPDDTEATAAAGTTSRCRSSSEAAVVKVGSLVTATTKRGKVYTGKVTTMDESGVILDVNGAEVELAADVQLVLVEDVSDGDDNEPRDPETGDTIEVITKRGKTILGKITEMDEDEVVIVDASGEQHELLKKNLDKVTVKVSGSEVKKVVQRGANKATSAAADTSTSTGRRAANGGVPVTVRMRELICDSLDATREEITASLKKENLEFKPETLNLIFADTKKVIGMLRDRKVLR